MQVALFREPPTAICSGSTLIAMQVAIIMQLVSLQATGSSRSHCCLMVF